MVTSSTNGYGTGTTWADSLRIDSNTVNGGYYGIYMYGYSSVSAAHNRDMKIRGNVVNNAHYTGLYLYYIQNGIDVLGNTLNMDATSASYGIYMYNCRNHYSGNAPHRIMGNRTQGHNSNYVYRSSAGASNPTLICNNIVSNLRAGSNYGFYIYNSSGYVGHYRFYHNSIHLASSTSGYGTYYYNPTSGGTVEIFNNIFMVSSGTSTYPLYCSTNPSGNVVNYNVYYNTSNTNILYRGGAKTVSTYHTATAGGDSSFVLSPSFASSSDLHLTDACATRGVDLTALVPTDFDGDTRASTPHIGADEVATFAEDLTMEELVLPTAPISTGFQDVVVRVKNVGSSTITAFDAGYIHNGGSPVTVSWSGTLPPCDTVSVVFSSSTQVNLGISNELRLFTSGPNYMTDLNTSNDTIVRYLYAPLSGNYTVGGTSPDYATLQDAVQALSLGVGGPVVFTVAPGTYTGQVEIGPVSGASSVNTITFDGVNRTSRILTCAVAGQATVLLNGCKHVIIKNFTIRNTSTTAVGVAIVGNVINDDGSNNIIRSNTIDLPNATGSSTSYGISQTATAWGYGGSANWIDSTWIDSNTILNGYYGIYIYSAKSNVHNQGIRITNNTITGQYQYGIYWYYNFSPLVVTGNDIDMNPAGSASNNGMYLYASGNTNASTTVSTVVAGNRVRANYGGIWLYYLNGSATAPTLCYNNYIYGFTYTTNYGIYAYNNLNYYYNLYHNTIQCESGVSGYGVYWRSTYGELKNNIIQITALTGSMQPVYCSTAPTGTNPFNYNIYYNRSGPNVVYRNSQYTYANYLSSSAGGDSSYYVVPPLAGVSDFHLTEGCKRGVNLTTIVPGDIEGDTRSATPNIGCDEFRGTTNDMGVIAVLSPAFPVSTGSQDLRVLVGNFGTNSITSFNLGYSLNGGTPQTQAWYGTLDPCDTVSLVFNGGQQVNLATAVNNIAVYTYDPNFAVDSNGINDTLRQQLSLPMSGNYTIGSTASDFVNFTEAVNALTARGTIGAVKFNVKTGTYTESVTITQVLGGYPVEFTSMAGDRDSVTLQSAGAAPLILANVSGITFRNITIAQMNAGSDAVVLAGECKQDTLDRCDVSVPNTTSACYTLYGKDVTVDNCAFTRNHFTGSYYGFYLYSSSGYSRNVVIDSNVFENGYYSPLNYLEYMKGLQFTNNVVHYCSAPTTTTNYTYFYYCDSGLNVSNNQFLHNRSGSSAYIYWNSCDGTQLRNRIWNNVFRAGSTTAKLYVAPAYSNCKAQDIYNNIIYTGGAYLYYMFYNTTDVAFFHNTVSSSSTSYTMYAYNTGNSNSKMLNNVLTNDGGGYAVYWNVAPVNELVDYNAYYTTGSSLIYGGSAYATLGTWKLRTANVTSKRDWNSVEGYAGLANVNTTLTPNPANVFSWNIQGRGTHLATTVSDFNGNPRPSNAAAGVPDIGAYEFDPTATPPALAAVPSTPSAGGVQHFLAGTDTVASIIWDAFTTPPASITARLYSGRKAPNIGTAPYYMNTYWNFTVPTGFYNYTMILRYKDAWLGTIPSEVDMKLAKKSPTSSWTIYNWSGSTADTSANTLTAAGLYDFSDFTGTDNITPLPVKLLSLHASQSGKDVLVEWSSATETNAASYAVERSFDNSSFTEIGRVNAGGTSSTTLSYSYTDAGAFNSRASVIYYRLRITDRDGSFTHTYSVAVVTGDAPRITLRAYPNPFSTDLTLSLPSQQTGNATVTITDIHGQVAGVQQFDLVQGNNRMEVRTGGLGRGVYFITVETGMGKIHTRVLRN
jgi:hypothetical protein